jgi:hypothetical protein
MGLTFNEVELWVCEERLERLQRSANVQLVHHHNSVPSGPQVPHTLTVACPAWGEWVATIEQKSGIRSMHTVRLDGVPRSFF